jgi:CBS domain-containing protein
MDWFASGLPREGRLAARVRVGDIAHRDAPPCEPRERVADVARRVELAGWDLCVVVDAERVVLGVLDAEGLRADMLAGQAMREGPRTLRPHVPVDDAAERFRRRDANSHLVITTSAGRLVGILRRSDLARTGGVQHTEASTR